MAVAVVMVYVSGVVRCTDMSRITAPHCAESNGIAWLHRHYSLLATTWDAMLSFPTYLHSVRTIAYLLGAFGEPIVLPYLMSIELALPAAPLHGLQLLRYT